MSFEYTLPLSLAHSEILPQGQDVYIASSYTPNGYVLTWQFIRDVEKSIARDHYSFVYFPTLPGDPIADYGLVSSDSAFLIYSSVIMVILDFWEMYPECEISILAESGRDTLWKRIIDRWLPIESYSIGIDSETNKTVFTMQNGWKGYRQ